MFTANDLVEIAVQIEKNGEQTYRRAAVSAADTNLSRLLSELAEDEANHRSWFLDLKTRLSFQPVDPALETMGRELFQKILGDQSFSLDGRDLGDLPGLAPLLRISAEFERDTIAFYEMLEPFMADDAGQRTLEIVIAEEKKHLHSLLEQLEPAG